MVERFLFCATFEENKSGWSGDVHASRCVAKWGVLVTFVDVYCAAESVEIASRR